MQDLHTQIRAPDWKCRLWWEKMHLSALRAGRLFFECYWQTEFRTILDIGSRDVNGTLRKEAPAAAEYIGIDLEAGPGVDKILTDPYEYPFPDGSMDCIVSTSCYEHDRMFWLTFLESCRVLSNKGFIYINAPSSGPYHAFPFDHWRFYPDSGVALQFWGRRMKYEVSLVESFLIPKKQHDTFGDCTMIFTKREKFTPSRYVADETKGSVNIRKGAGGSLIRRAPVGVWDQEQEKEP